MLFVLTTILTCCSSLLVLFCVVVPFLPVLVGYTELPVVVSGHQTGATRTQTTETCESYRKLWDAATGCFPAVWAERKCKEKLIMLNNHHCFGSEQERKKAEVDEKKKKKRKYMYARVDLDLTWPVTSACSWQPRSPFCWYGNVHCTSPVHVTPRARPGAALELILHRLAHAQSTVHSTATPSWTEEVKSPTWRRLRTCACFFSFALWSSWSWVLSVAHFEGRQPLLDHKEPASPERKIGLSRLGSDDLLLLSMAGQSVLHYSDESTIQYSWTAVATVFWRRYPNPFAAHVLSEDVLDRKVEDGKLVTKRLISKTNSVPRWGAYLLRDRGDTAFVIEESVVDPVARCLTTRTRNISLNYWSTVVEKCTYSPSADGSQTCVKREATFSSNARFVSSRIASFCRYRYKNNISKSLAGWNFVLKSLCDEQAERQPLSKTLNAKALQKLRELPHTQPVVTSVWRRLCTQYEHCFFFLFLFSFFFFFTAQAIFNGISCIMLSKAYRKCQRVIFILQNRRWTTSLLCFLLDLSEQANSCWIFFLLA